MSELAIIDFVRLRSELKKILLEVDGHMLQCPIAGGASAAVWHLVTSSHHVMRDVVMTSRFRMQHERVFWRVLFFSFQKHGSAQGQLSWSRCISILASQESATVSDD